MSKFDDERLEAMRVAMVMRGRKADKQIIEEINDEEEEEEEKNDEIDYETLYNDLSTEGRDIEMLDSIEGSHRLITKILEKSEIETTTFNIDEEEKMKVDKNGNIIPSKEEESNDETGDEDEEQNENQLSKEEENEEAAEAAKFLLSVIEENQSVLELLTSFPDDSQEFIDITEAATTLLFTGNASIYTMDKAAINELYEHLLSR